MKEGEAVRFLKKFKKVKICEDGKLKYKKIADTLLLLQPLLAPVAYALVGKINAFFQEVCIYVRGEYCLFPASNRSKIKGSLRSNPSIQVGKGLPLL